MSGYADYTDPDYLVWQQEKHRERVLSSIRGYLTQKRWSRWKVAGILIACGLPYLGGSWLAATCGASKHGMAQALGVLAAWPFCLLMLRWLASSEARRLDIGNDWKRFAGIDEKENCFREPDPKQHQYIEGIARGIESGIRGGGNQGQAVLLVLALGFLTAGIWILWSFIKNSTTILAEIMLDGDLIPRHPTIFNAMPTEEWHKEALVSTGFYFFALAFSMMLLAWVLPYFFLYVH